ncbi:GGDEF domain-containing protein [Motilimonas cestriensis]|uniref:diguanylate cyclase n=1 Tax=Motilimonas cestriensis TaxID=2742685 RepID=A0ABS8WGG2_9GAMM|nr:GGDEF domain-containing protein [Motilimonas cestriensis]MCE2596856.1 GGDEF domain-containing protein [Motilimonas cestriensis]
MSKKLFQKSTENLRKAVPLMIKNQVPTTPTNYALWYTYVDNSLPQMNKELDQAITDYGMCPPATGETLYRTYVASKTETDIRQLRSSLELLLNEVSHSMTDTLADTQDFQQMIDKNFDCLSRVEDEGLSFEEVMELVRGLISESKEIRHSTRFLNNQLNTASSEVERLKKQLEQVQKDALYDSLSSLLNRRALDNDLVSLCATEQPFSFILVDIDHFKKFNDEYGHLFGDSVIKAIARRLQLSCRDGITAYRFGGEEFALVVPGKNLRVARQLAESIRRAIEKVSVKDKRSNRQVDHITASFGVAEYSAKESASSLIDKADKQLYEAKRLGRNRVLPMSV